jgi:hypothetical protein
VATQLGSNLVHTSVPNVNCTPLHLLCSVLIRPRLAGAVYTWYAATGLLQEPHLCLSLTVELFRPAHAICLAALTHCRRCGSFVLGALGWSTVFWTFSLASLLAAQAVWQIVDHFKYPASKYGELVAVSIHNTDCEFGSCINWHHECQALQDQIYSTCSCCCCSMLLLVRGWAAASSCRCWLLAAGCRHRPPVHPLRGTPQKKVVYVCAGSRCWSPCS